MNYIPLTRSQMACRVAQDIDEGSYVNLGIGLPTTIANFIPDGKEVIFQSENGILGVGSSPSKGFEDFELVNVSAQPVTLIPGGAIVNHVDSFVMIRGGHINISVMGAFQVSEEGDLANWITDKKSIPAIGGAMDLAIGAERVFVLMEHTTKSGQPRILKECTYPLTASGVVSKIYTNLSVIDVTEKGLVVTEIVEGLTFEELQGLTDARLIKADKVNILMSGTSFHT